MVALSSPAHCQPADPAHLGDVDSRYSHDTWSIREGLPQNTINAILQTRDGYLWLATFGGLMRFDGVGFTVFEMATAEGLVSNRLLALYEDRGGRLWIGHEQKGVTVFDHGIFTTVAMREADRGHVWAFAEDLQGRLWAATEDGLYRWDDGGFARHPAGAGLPSDRLRSVFVDARGSLWIATNRGAARLADGRLTLYDTRDGLPSNAVRAFLEDEEGSLWIGTGGGLAVFRDGRLQAVPVAGGEELSVECLTQDPSGNLWVGTDDGLVLLELRRAAEPGGLPILRPFASHFGGVMRSLATDREGDVWVGTNTSGLSRLKERQLRHYPVPIYNDRNSVAAITGDGAGGVWVAASCGLLYRWNSDRLVPQDVAGLDLASFCLQTVSRSGSGALWLGGFGALARLENGSVTRWSRTDGLPAARIRALFEDRSGRLWMGTEGQGLVSLDGGGLSRLTTQDGLLDDDVSVITEDRVGTIWIGSRGGLSRLQDGRFTHYTAADGLARGMVRDIHEDAGGTLWIGTYGGGLSRFKSGAFTRITREDGLYDNAVSRILEDASGHLWMLSNLGIFAVDRRDLDAFADGRVRFFQGVSFGAEDGMVEGNGQCQPAGWRTGDGKMWFPTIAGVAVIDAERFRSNHTPPPVVIERVVVDGVTFDGRAAVDAAPGDGDLEIHYTGLSFVAPSKVRFQYRLDGRDRDWQDAGPRRVALYTNIPPGSYTFRVIAANNDGVWNESGAAVSITLAPYVHETAWFRAAVAVLVALAGLAVFQIRTRNVTERNRRLRAEIVERRRAQQEKEKLIADLEAKNAELERFTYTVSHDLKSPLVTINGFLGHLENDLKSGKTERVGENFDYIRRATGQMSHLLDDLLELSRIGRVVHKSEEVALGDVANEVVAVLAGRIREKAVEVEVGNVMPTVWGDRARLREVLQNLIENAVKFMGDQVDPHVRIGGRHEDGAALFFVRDNGSGIPPAFHDTVFGLFNQLNPAIEGTGIGLALVRRIVEFHGGRIWVESEGSGRGSTFYVSLPLRSGPGRVGSGENP